MAYGKYGYHQVALQPEAQGALERLLAHARVTKEPGTRLPSRGAVVSQLILRAAAALPQAAGEAQDQEGGKPVEKILFPPGKEVKAVRSQPHFSWI